jgi:hypothetical protein
VDLGETLVRKVISEETANCGLDFEDRVFRRCTQIQNSVVQTRVGIDSHETVIGLAICLLRSENI